MRSPTADWYARAATRDLVGHSALHVAWAAGVADDEEVLALLDRLPRERRQPSLIFSVATWVGAQLGDYPQFREFLLARWPEIEVAARERRTQTNEVGRCAPLVAALAAVPGPIALLEVGAAAGLCCLPDLYSYRFGDAPPVGSGSPLLEVAVAGDGPSVDRLPDIRWRRGLDVSPLSAASADDARWLEALIPLDRPDRRARLRAALAAARADPPVVERGDALDDLARVAAGAPGDATLVVASLGTLVYLAPEARAAFPAAVADLGARLVALEQAGLVDDAGARVAPGAFVLSLDGRALAEVSPHGDRLRWLGADSAILQADTID